MKRNFLSVFLLTINLAAMACPVCEKQQPKLLKGILHGVGPESNWDYAIPAGVTAVVVVAFTYSIKYLLKPGETSKNHIKRLILNH